MSKSWSNIGAWAADVEREEQEAAEAAEAAAAAEVGGPAAPPAQSQNYPSLREAVSAKPKKKKMSLNEFYSSGAVTGGGPAYESKGLTPDEMLRLPTGPKERSADEMQYGRLGGGFSGYGRSGAPPGRMRDRDDADGSWAGGRRQYGGGFNEERRGPPSRVSDFDQPSRADEVDNWAMAKKSLPTFDSVRPGRYSSLGGGGGGIGGGSSRADEVDNWASTKKPFPARVSNFGTGFRDSGPEPDRWNRGMTREPERDRPRLVLDPPKGDVGANEAVKTNRPSPFGEARPREEILAEKGLDWKKIEMEIEAKKTSRPTSAHSSRPSSAHSSRSEGPGLPQQQQQGLENMVKPKPKVNPFGDAKPREVLLEERGQDWRKIDLELEHRRIDRPETEEEKVLKEEIENLKKELQSESPLTENREPVPASGEDQSSLRDVISQKEMELEALIRDLDDKVRFGQKAVERPRSGSSRSTSFSDRPPSQSGSFDESRSVEFMDRPRSRGRQDIWTRPVDDRRGFQGGRDRGFLGSRDFDRSKTRQRW